jgi:glutathione S-transferase
LYYEDQKAESLRRARYFVSERIPKYLGWLERVLERGDGDHLVGREHSYADLCAFQLVEGIAYAFPKALGRIAPKIPRLSTLRTRVAERPKIKAYLASERRVPFNTKGLFRHYAELDLDVGDEIEP